MGDGKAHQYRDTCSCTGCIAMRHPDVASAISRTALAERATVVAWLRERARIRFPDGTVHNDEERLALADAIERGEHVKGET